ncbi:Uncharacterised protein [Mycobacterium tuberculosis]|nr:Uncharacterised protein [Mycobacterium tuberculosis]
MGGISKIDRRKEQRRIPPASESARALTGQGVTVRAGIPVARFRPLNCSACVDTLDEPFIEGIAHTNTPSAIASMSANTRWYSPSRTRSAGLRCSSNRFGENIHTFAWSRGSTSARASAT